MDNADKGGGLWVVQLLEERCLDPILIFPDQLGSAPVPGPPPRPEPASPVRPPPPPSTTKPLEQLSVDELERWLASINLSRLASNLKEHDVAAEGLSLCRREEELLECGLTATNARLLMRRIEEVRTAGVELTAISAPPPVPTPAPLRPPTPAPHSVIPSIARPSDKDFMEYVKEGKTEQVAEALLHYPDLAHVQGGGGWTALLVASCDGHASIVEIMGLFTHKLERYSVLVNVSFNGVGPSTVGIFQRQGF
eukprot:gene36344-biopygen3036